MRPLSLRHRIEGRLARGMMRLPRPLLLGLAGGRPTVRDGFELDPQLALAIALHKRLGKPLTHELDVAGARAELELSCAVFAPRPRALDRVEDHTFPGPAGQVPVRVYRPRKSSKPCPALVFFHGGGFVLGSLESHDGCCRVLAEEAECVVVAVDYRLAPEHKFPAAVDDAVAAFRWVAASASTLGIDPIRIAVGGDSAGGNLSAVVSQEVRRNAVRPCFQLLIYPAVDFTLSGASIQSMGKGFLLERATIDWFLDHYLPPGHDRKDPRASPLFAEDFSGLPPALVQTAGFDPLRDEGQAYAKRLREAGVRVEHRCYESLFHGFFSTSGTITAAGPALLAGALALRGAFTPGRAAP